MSNKYKITDETIVHNGHILHRIEALKDFATIKKGEKGGWVEDEFNLSQLNNCWIFDEAKSFEAARVLDDAQMRHYSQISGNARAIGTALIGEHAQIFGRACINQNGWVNGNAKVFGRADILGNAWIGADAEIGSNSDYATFLANWREMPFYFTYTKSNDTWRFGEFLGNSEELIEFATKHNQKDVKHFKNYIKLIEEENKL